MGDMGEIFRDYKDHTKERKNWHQENTLPKDLALLKTLPVLSKKESDGAGGDKYVIEIGTKFGIRKVDWWCSTGKWKDRKGKGEGTGLSSFMRYFKLEPYNG